MENSNRNCWSVFLRKKDTYLSKTLQRRNLRYILSNYLAIEMLKIRNYESHLVHDGVCEFLGCSRAKDKRRLCSVGKGRALL